MKKQLLKKFYAFIIMILFSIVTANAQIVYTDVNPDSVLSCSSISGCSGNYSLDLNNDGINDFILGTRSSRIGCRCGGPRGGHLALADNDSALLSSTSFSWIADTAGGYALNTVIDSSLGWTNVDHILASKLVYCGLCTELGVVVVRSPGSGNWNNIYGKYLALKIQVGTDFYYGWIKLGVGTDIDSVSITIMEYAYNSIPNQPILSGQTIAAGIIENSFASSINLFPNPADNHLTIALGSNNKKVDVTITDITGKIIYTITTNETNKIEVNTKEFIEGIYVVQIQAADFIGTKKLAVEK